jgi:hypothetical protein
MGVADRTTLEPERETVMEPIKWTGRKRLPVIRQTESAECGLACLAMMACWHGLQTDLPTLRERFSISTQGMTLQRLMECAQVSGCPHVQSVRAGRPEIAFSPVHSPLEHESFRCSP